MKLARIMHMSPRKLVGRLHQEELKLLERLHIIGSGQLQPDEICRSLVPGPMEDAIRGKAQSGHIEDATKMLLDRFRQGVSSRFFPGATHAGTPLLISEQHSDAREAVLQAASKSFSGRFDLLGYLDLDFGEPVNWHLEPVARKEAKIQHWSRIDPLDRASVGDHKIVWELNRHQWLLHWAQAYMFTGDEAYAERSVETLDSWLRANPPGRGLNWASSLELGMRLIAWCWALVFLRHSEALRPNVFGRLLGAIHAHATHIARHLSTTFSPNTHLLGEALALFYVGVLFPESERAAEWRTQARTILVEEIGRQVMPDGVYFEHSTCYQRYAAEMYMHFLILAEQNAVEVPALVAERVQTCLDFLLAIRRSGGHVGQIGDGDGGWLLPLVPRETEDMRGVFATAAALFGRSDCAEASGGPTLEVAWLLGPSAVRDIAALPSTPASLEASRLFSDGGYAVLRSDFGPSAHQMIFDVGPLGCPISGAHGHADLLAVTCDVFGEPCIVDPGMPHYGGDPAWRDAFRSTALHSSIVVDRLSQALPDGPFSWQRRPEARLRSWISNRDFDFVDGEHDAYRFRDNVVTHRRRVIFVKPWYWVVVDDLDEVGGGGVDHHIDLGFQFAPHVRLSMEPPWVRAVTPASHALLVHTTASVSLEAAIHEGEQAPLAIRGWFSPAYGKIQPAPAIGFAATTRLPLRIVTALLPLERADAPVPEVFPPAADVELVRHLSI